MSQTFDTIEGLKDDSLINENTYMLLMNAMKRDYDRGRIVNPSATQAVQPTQAVHTSERPYECLFWRPPCDLSAPMPSWMQKSADAYNRAAERGRAQAAARRRSR